MATACSITIIAPADSRFYISRRFEEGLVYFHRPLICYKCRRAAIGSLVPLSINVMGRKPCCSEEDLNKGAWTEEEDRILTDYVKSNGEGRWRSLPKKAGIYVPTVQACIGYVCVRARAHHQTSSSVHIGSISYLIADSCFVICKL